MSGQSLKVGVYDRAERASFRSAGRPGLDIGGDGRGCNTVAGSFEVRDIGFASSGAVSRLHLLYEQHCEGGPAALFGEVRYREPVVAGPAPESSSVTWPITYAGAASTVVPVTVRAAGRSVRIASAKVTGVDAAAFPVRVDECTGRTLSAGASCQVLLRFAPTGAGPRSAQLTLVDGAGRATPVQLDGSARPGTTGLQIVGDPGDFVSGGRSYAFSPATARFRVDGTRQRISASVDSGGTGFSIDLGAAPGDVLAPGTYDGAQRFPFNGSAPGLSVDGNGRGCNTLTGSFTIAQAVFSPVDGSLEHLRATFEQHCEGFDAALRGTLTFQAAADTVGPARVTGLSATSTSDGVRLRWTDPGGDARRTVVRALPGTTAPTRADAGLAVPVSKTTAEATRLASGTAYAFAVFRVDATGNVGPAAVVRATTPGTSATLEG